MEQFSKRLRELRTERKLTQKKLAEILKTTNSSICDWECGRNEPNIEMIINLSLFFQVSTDYLLGVED